MMKYKLIYILTTLLLVGNYSFAGNLNTVKYVSEANDMALITLELNDNGKFILSFKVVGKKKTQKFKGKWLQKMENYQLTFKGLKRPDLSILFKQKKNSTGVKIDSKRQVSVSKNQQSIWIWGIYCQKQ